MQKYTDLTFFTNEPGRTLLERFRDILRANTKYFDVLVGFWGYKPCVRAYWKALKLARLS
ncbi:MAG: hypothetical protein GXO18_06930 [Aquificae bacterium]|nr:hypothetical protein [Aquificota bacterium]